MIQDLINNPGVKVELQSDSKGSVMVVVKGKQKEETTAIPPSENMEKQVEKVVKKSIGKVSDKT